jgi:hypothetical protein
LYGIFRGHVSGHTRTRTQAHTLLSAQIPQTLQEDFLGQSTGSVQHEEPIHSAAPRVCVQHQAPWQPAVAHGCFGILGRRRPQMLRAAHGGLATEEQSDSSLSSRRSKTCGLPMFCGARKRNARARQIPSPVGAQAPSDELVQCLNEGARNINACKSLSRVLS